MPEKEEIRPVIEVREETAGDPLAFSVTVREGRSETSYSVTMSRATLARLGQGKVSSVQVIEASFHFLLDHEPKESILATFDVSVIARYFPEFERELPHYLTRHSR